MVNLEVRAQDAFDVPAFGQWLAQAVPGLGDITAIKQFAGGASNLTFQIDCANDSVVLRTSPTGRKASGAHDMQREARLLSALRPHYDKVPEVLAVAGEQSPLGRPLFISEFVRGEILRRDVPSTAPVAQMADTFITAFVDLHAVDTTTGELSAFNKGTGYVRRQVDGWSSRYRQARTPDVPDAESVMGWLDARQPADVASCVIHNDWRFDNMVLDPDDLSHIKAVLDWELATVGDPFMDLGSALAYWVQADDDEGMLAFRMQPSTAPGMPTREQFVDEYCRRAGRQRPDWLFYEVYGLFRLAGIAVQIWYRYYHGQTDNPRFAVFGPAVQYLIARCERLIGQ
ncbi:MAG: phosphotransferase family protein [Candidatus Nanopelagicales bacterium]